MLRINPITSFTIDNIQIPGSKYLANRLLIIAALSKGESILSNVPGNDDINIAIKALRDLGVKIIKKESSFKISGSNGKINPINHEINVGDSGTLLRFLIAFSSLSNSKIKISGNQRLQERPIIDLINALKNSGIKIKSKNGFAPLEIIGGELQGGLIEIRGDISSQFISSLLIISPFAQNDVSISLSSELVSAKYVDMTIDIMRVFGVKVSKLDNRTFFIKSGQRYTAQNFTITSDWVSSSYILAAAALTNNEITILNINPNSKQGEAQFYKILEKMGCNVKIDSTKITISGNKTLKGIDIDMKNQPDVVPTLAAIAPFCFSKTVIRNIKHLKDKESDRIKVITSELQKLGCKIHSNEDSITIYPSILNKGIVDPHNDHRIAMSFALIGLKSPLIIKNPQVVSKSFPDYWEKLKESGVKVQKLSNIVLIGYRGSGKSTIASLLSSFLNKKTINIDIELEKKYGEISDIIKEKGWEFFREIESQFIQGISSNNVIIDCGGGVIENPENMSKLRDNGIVIWLKAKEKTIIKRISNKKNRPALTNSDFVSEISTILEQREPLYQKYSDIEINTDNKLPEELVLEIAERIKE